MEPERATGVRSPAESEDYKRQVSTTESTTVESLGTEFEPLGVSFSEQLVNTPTIAAKPMNLRAIFTTPQ